MDLSNNKLEGLLIPNVAGYLNVENQSTRFKVDEANLIFDLPLIIYEQHYHCQSVYYVDSASQRYALSVDPSIFNYKNCYCSSNYYGLPPNNCVSCLQLSSNKLNVTCSGVSLYYPKGNYYNPLNIK